MPAEIIGFNARPASCCAQAICWLIAAVLLAWTAAIPASSTLAAPAGYVRSTITLNAPPVALAFAPDGTLLAVEEAGFSNNTAAVRVISPEGVLLDDLVLAGDDELNLFLGGAAFDPIGNRLLATDNTTDGRLYALTLDGAQQTLATGLQNVAGVAVRPTGEIFVSTAGGGGQGQVLQIDRTSFASTPVVTGLDFGAGLAFDAAGDLFVQEADDATPFLGRYWRVPITAGPSGLSYGAPTPLLSGATPAAGLAVDSEGDLFATGSGGVYALAGSPLVVDLFDDNGNSQQFAAAIAFSPGAAPFEPFAGPDGGRLAVMADYGFGAVDSFVTIFTPAEPADFNSDGAVDGDDFAVWSTNFGATAAPREAGDATADGHVDGGDFLTWQRSYSPSSEPAATTVPEPVGWQLAAVAAAGALISLCRGRQSASAHFCFLVFCFERYSS